MPTKIGWCDETWEVVSGCTHVSPGCAHCYAEAMAPRLGVDFKTVTTHPERLEQPYHWRKPRRIFVCSRSDLFHPDVPWEFIDRVFEVIRYCPQHTFQVLTKRPERACDWPDSQLYYGGGDHAANLWFGTSTENQEWLYKRLPSLRKFQHPMPAVRWLSCEPLLGPLDLSGALHDGDLGAMVKWVVAGGESGPHYRPMKVEWLEDIVEQCDRAGVPVFVKQDSGRWPERQGRIPPGLWKRKEFPEGLWRPREFPV